MKALLFLIFLLHICVALAQNPAEAQFYQKMDLGVELMEVGDHEGANTEFVYVLKNMSALPSDLAYYFGKNSYFLGKYKQSINWLNKYIQLKGTQGRFYDDAVSYLQLSEDEYLKISRKNNSDIRTELESGEYDCGGLSKMICPVCKGEGVVFKQGPFEILYQTCPYSNGEPYLSCEDYNLFMRGQLQPVNKQ